MMTAFTTWTISLKSLNWWKFNTQHCREKLIMIFSGQQEQPAIIISRLRLRMHGTYIASFVWNYTWNEWNVQNAICLIWHAFGPSISGNLITPVLSIIYNMNLTQSRALKQKHFGLWWMSLDSKTFGYNLFIHYLAAWDYDCSRFHGRLKETYFVYCFINIIHKYQPNLYSGDISIQETLALVSRESYE